MTLIRRQRIMKLIAGLALLVCVAMFGSHPFLHRAGTLQEEEMLELCADIRHVDVTSTSESTYVEISTASPQFTLFVPPYVTEQSDADLKSMLIPGSTITFMIRTEEAEQLYAGKGLMVYSLSVDGNPAFTLAEYHAYWRIYTQEMYMISARIGGIAFAVLVFCLLAIWRIHRMLWKNWPKV